MFFLKSIDVYKFLNGIESENDWLITCELQWYGDELICRIYADELTTFCKFFKEFFEDNYDFEAYIIFDYKNAELGFVLNDILEFYEIELEDILEKE